MGDFRVDEELEGETDYADNGEGKADARGRHAEAAGEEEAVGLEIWGVWVFRIEPRGGEVEGPEAVEGAYVHGESAMGEHCHDEVGGPNAAEGELLADLLAWFIDLVNNGRCGCLL